MKRTAIAAIALIAAAVFAQDGGESVELTPRIALGVVSQAVKTFRGTLDEHSLIQASLKQLEAAVRCYEEHEEAK